jgi:hypothetical protein
MPGRDEIEWAPRLPKEKIRRLYQSDAEGLLDDELLDDVGTRLYQRCKSILEIDAAKNGEVRCPVCERAGRETFIHRERVHGALEAALTCPVCGWQIVWHNYLRSFKRRQLNQGGAGDAFIAFVQGWPAARTPAQKMLAVDQLIHAFHFSVQQMPDLPSRPAALNLIKGKLDDVLLFLDELSAGPASTPGVDSTRQTWQSILDRYRREYLRKG